LKNRSENSSTAQCLELSPKELLNIFILATETKIDPTLFTPYQLAMHKNRWRELSYSMPNLDAIRGENSVIAIMYITG
jgi:hypothetical protein